MDYYFAFNHEESEYTAYSTDSRLKDIFDYYTVEDLGDNDFCIVRRDDEDISVFNTSITSNDNILENIMKDIDDDYLIEAFEADNEVELEIPCLGYFYYNFSPEDYDNDPESLSAIKEEIAKEIIKNFNDTQVDGDSGSVYVLLNVRTGETPLGGWQDMYSMSSEDIDEILED